MAKEQTSLPAWVWLFTGVITGLFLAFLYHLVSIKPSDEQLKGIQISSSDNANSKSSGKFDFYTLLPGREVVAPETEQPVSTQKPGVQSPVNTAPPQQLLIQTGSFRSAQEADHRRAQLILLGLDVQVQKVELNPGETWHRVQIGPFNTGSDLSQAKQTLAENKIEHIVVRLKK